MDGGEGEACRAEAGTGWPMSDAADSEWERVTEEVTRRPVPGGWLYRYGRMRYAAYAEVGRVFLPAEAADLEGSGLGHERADVSACGDDIGPNCWRNTSPISLSTVKR